MESVMTLLGYPNYTKNKEWDVRSTGQRNELDTCDYLCPCSAFDLKSKVLCDLSRIGCPGGGQKKGAS